MDTPKALTPREQLAETVINMKTTATMVVQRHAAIYARDVPTETVESICRALGDISIDEALTALDRLQVETTGASPTGWEEG